ncbi:MAG: hypothetical protein HC883_00440 [Bdellovibrionaceae bacterium]|nr:hypothetical protein [Pseudobdellovibrionaceae bacterium]
MTQTRRKQKEELVQQGNRLKKQIKALYDSLDRKGRLKLKVELLKGDLGETVIRCLFNGTYDSNPRQDSIEVMEDVLASFGKAKAS